MKKPAKSSTKTISASAKKGGSKVVSHRKNTSASTRAEGRQRSGNNSPQHGSH